MEKYIGDNEVILKIAGLRWIKKVDYGGSIQRERYCLEWNYKGAAGSAEYEIKEERNAFYEKILKELQGQQ